MDYLGGLISLNLVDISAVTITTTGTITGTRHIATSLGTVGAPSFSIGDGDSGLYESVDDTVVMSCGGVAASTWTATTLVAPGTIQGTRHIGTSLGTAGAPTFAVGDGDTGLYESSDDNLVVSIAGVAKVLVNGSGIATQNSGGIVNAGSTKNTAFQIATQIAANTNNWNPHASFATSRVIYVDTDAARDLTGIDASLISDGFEFELCVYGANTLTLKHASGSSGAANRFNLVGAGDLAIAGQFRRVTLRYGMSNTEWQVVSKNF